MLLSFLFGPFGGAPDISRYFGLSKIVDLDESFRMRYSTTSGRPSLTRYCHFSDQSPPHPLVFFRKKTILIKSNDKEAVQVQKVEKTLSVLASGAKSILLALGSGGATIDAAEEVLKDIRVQMAILMYLQAGLRQPPANQSRSSLLLRARAAVGKWEGVMLTPEMQSWVKELDVDKLLEAEEAKEKEAKEKERQAIAKADLDALQASGVSSSQAVAFAKAAKAAQEADAVPPTRISKKSSATAKALAGQGAGRGGRRSLVE